MSAQQIPQNSTASVTAPCLMLGTVTSNSAQFDGPAITVTESATSLPHTFANPSGWAIVIDSAVTAETASFTVTVPLTATVSGGGGYNLSYYDSAGNYYSQWFDVILAGTTPAEPAIPQIMQGTTGTISIPIVALTYKAKFISVDSPDAGTWLDDGNQALPYPATFAEAPAPAGWGLTLTAYNGTTLTYTATVTVPVSNEFGVYLVTVSDGGGHIYESEFDVIPAPPGVEPAQSCCFNGFDVVNEVQVLLGESQSTTAQQQSMLYLRHVQRTLDEIARRTWATYDTAVCNIVSGKIEYEMPSRPYELRSVCVNDGSGNVRVLSTITAEEADNRYYGWQNTTYPSSTPLWSGIPQNYIDEGANRFWLFPVPNYNQIAGLIVRGYYGCDGTYTMDQCLPLPEGYSEVVVMGTAYRRCREMAPQNPVYKEMLPLYKADYETLLRRLYRERINRTDATRNAIPSLGKRFGWCGNWSWVAQ